MTQPLENGDLRDWLLREMLGDCLSLSHIDSVVAHNYSAESPPDRQARLTALISSLLADGLVVMGDIVGASDERVEPWQLPIEEAMARLHDLYVTHYDTWDKWGWVVWFALTESGERVAGKL